MNINEMDSLLQSRSAPACKLEAIFQLSGSQVEKLEAIHGRETSSRTIATAELSHKIMGAATLPSDCGNRLEKRESQS